jgi:hypothetical protein
MRYNIKFSVTIGGESQIKFEVHYIESKYRFYETIIDLLKEKYPEGEIKIIKTREAMEGVAHGL